MSESLFLFVFVAQQQVSVGVVGTRVGGLWVRWSGKDLGGWGLPASLTGIEERFFTWSIENQVSQFNIHLFCVQTPEPKFTLNGPCTRRVAWR